MLCSVCFPSNCKRSQDDHLFPFKFAKLLDPEASWDKIYIHLFFSFFTMLCSVCFPRNCKRPQDDHLSPFKFAKLLDPEASWDKVKTVEGTIELQIWPGTEPGDVLVLAKKGAPKLNQPSVRGDHLFTIKVTVPQHIRSFVLGAATIMLVSIWI